MRVLLSLLIAALLITTGAYPALAALIGSLLMFTIGLTLHGAALLLAQTAVKLAVLAAGAVWLLRNRTVAA